MKIEGTVNLFGGDEESNSDDDEGAIVWIMTVEQRLNVIKTVKTVRPF